MPIVFIGLHHITSVSSNLKLCTPVAHPISSFIGSVCLHADYGNGRIMAVVYEEITVSVGRFIGSTMMSSFREIGLSIYSSNNTVSDRNKILMLHRSFRHHALCTAIDNQLLKINVVFNIIIIVLILVANCHPIVESW